MKEKIIRYSESFRRTVVAEYEKGETVGELQRKYGIGGNNTIKGWVKKYGKEGMRRELIVIQTEEDIFQEKELKKRVIELEQALGKMTLEKLRLESVVEILEESYGTEIKKNAAKLLDEPIKKLKKS